MAQKTMYRNALRSRRLIREAFLQLIQEKEVGKITVTDIVRLADINRATFYAHYPDVRGVIEEIENEIIDRLMGFLNEFEFHSFFREPEVLLQKVSDYLEENAGFFRTLIMANGAEKFLEKLNGIFVRYMTGDPSIPEAIRSHPLFTLHINYFAGGVLNVYKKWFSGELDCPLADIPKALGSTISLAARSIEQQTEQIE